MNKQMSQEELNVHRKNIQEYHDRITGLEADLARQQEGLREYLNRHNLNKGDFDKAYPV